MSEKYSFQGEQVLLDSNSFIDEYKAVPEIRHFLTPEGKDIYSDWHRSSLCSLKEIFCLPFLCLLYSIHCWHGFGWFLAGSRPALTRRWPKRGALIDLTRSSRPTDVNSEGWFDIVWQLQKPAKKTPLEQQR